jgi:hypothetical protein
MGSAVRQRAVPFFLEDILAFGRGLSLSEHRVTAHEVGRIASDVVKAPDHLVIGIARGSERLQFNELAGQSLKVGDIIVYLNAHEEPPENQDPFAARVSNSGKSHPAPAK